MMFNNSFPASQKTYIFSTKLMLFILRIIGTLLINFVGEIRFLRLKPVVNIVTVVS
jgi:hypothetical protein